MARSLKSRKNARGHSRLFKNTLRWWKRSGGKGVGNAKTALETSLRRLARRFGMTGKRAHRFIRYGGKRLPSSLVRSIMGRLAQVKSIAKTKGWLVRGTGPNQRRFKKLKFGSHRGGAYWSPKSGLRYRLKGKLGFASKKHMARLGLISRKRM